MKVNFAEIWDYYLEFMDWKTTTIMNAESPKDSFNPYLVIKMDNAQAIDNKVQSEVVKNTFTPYWSKIDKGITFRGTYHELKASELIVEIWHKPMGFAKKLGEKIVPLKEVIDVNFAKADVIIHESEGTGGAGEILNDDDLDKPAQTCEVQGTVAIGSYPKYRQKGEDELIAFREQYLCIKIIEADVFGDISDGSDVECWVQVNWGGVAKDTKHFKK